ncbi:hypothetical protein P8C59_007265 [Phyllachora maydis]|uniref:Uncharacterized protein n=1 Tax=Phyllachora maydis TaxID=1825666 RepID=A0AAD9ME21_9PEZI|nr:hypothetical protein P8C59_007265 [Phyllachora maydis]
MFSVLPDLTPRDCHSLWYTSSRRPNQLPPYLDPAVSQPDGAQAGPTAGASARPRAVQAAIIDRSAPGRMRADETFAERRRLHVSNMGSTWLKPPGVAKTLFQLREERREAEEHAEAVRREQLHQELADAEAAGGTAGAAGAADAREDLDGDLVMDEEDDMGRDLDDEIPDADADEGGLGFDGTSDDDEDSGLEDSEEEDDLSDEDSEEGGEAYGENLPAASANQGSSVQTHQQRQERRELAHHMAIVRATEDRMRELVAARGREAAGAGELYGEEVDLENGEQADILDEEDLVEDSRMMADMDPGLDLHLDADLDAAIPDGDGGGYEHTDSDASLSSDNDDDGGGGDDGPIISYVGRPPRVSGYRTSLPRSDAARNSIDFSSLVEGDGSSLPGGSPHLRRRM